MRTVKINNDRIHRVDVFNLPYAELVGKILSYNILSEQFSCYPL